MLPFNRISIAWKHMNSPKFLSLFKYITGFITGYSKTEAIEHFYVTTYVDKIN